ncbi:MAG TPA: hypothetical protein VEG65_04345 [Candidatus Bathyarchaeia archaeon]|nr:hypothetical protein [Candidatus Bathyarchaeia archaeon]
MSLGLVVKVPEGLVLAAESRVTVTVADKQTGMPRGQAAYDNTTKLFSFKRLQDFIGVVTYGQAFIGKRTAFGYFTEFNERLGERASEQRMSVYDFATELSDFFNAKWNAEPPTPPLQGMVQEPMSFLVAGYNAEEANGRIYLFVIPDSPEPVEQNQDNFGITYGGDIGIIYRLINGYDVSLQQTMQSVPKEQLEALQLPVPFDALPLQDAVDLAILLIRTTISVQKLAVMPRSCGGPIDVCTITSVDGLRYVQRKEITGEKESAGGL